MITYGNMDPINIPPLWDRINIPAPLGSVMGPRVPGSPAGARSVPRCVLWRVGELSPEIVGEIMGFGEKISMAVS